MKRILSILISLIMLILLVPAGVFAEGEAPTKLKAYSGYKRVTLEWTKSDAPKYLIKRANAKKPDAWTVLAKDVTANKYVDKTAKQDVNYLYRVYANDENGKYAEAKGRTFWQIHYSFRFRTKRVLKSHTGGKKKATFKRNTKKEAIDYRKGKYVFMHKGRQYHVLRISTYKQKVSHMDNKGKHSEREATDFVNQKGLKSNTKYLIFVNTYTQHEYIFKGKKGKWKCIKNCPIATGRASSPTGTGLTRIKQKDPVEHGLPYWSVCGVFSIHGLPSGAKVNYPTSGACVRNYNKNAQWIYKNCKIGTAVFVY